MTESGTCVPPGPSKNTVGARKAEKRSRTASMSRATVGTNGHYPAEVSTLTPPRERLDRGSGTGLGRPWKVIVLNDNHNTFEGVAFALPAVLPRASVPPGHAVGDPHPLEGPGDRVVGRSGAGRAVLGAARRSRLDARAAR